MRRRGFDSLTVHRRLNVVECIAFMRNVPNHDAAKNNFHAMVEYVSHLEQAKEYLQEIFLEISLDGKPKPETLYKIQDFFGHDDSE